MKKNIIKIFKLNFLEKNKINDSVLNTANSSLKKIPGHYVGTCNDTQILSKEGSSIKGKEIVVISNINNDKLSTDLQSKDILPNVKKNCTSGLSEPKIFDANNEFTLKNKSIKNVDKDHFREHYELTKN